MGAPWSLLVAGILLEMLLPVAFRALGVVAMLVVEVAGRRLNPAKTFTIMDHDETLVSTTT